jgi:hypothetical protein
MEQVKREIVDAMTHLNTQTSLHNSEIEAYQAYQLNRRTWLLTLFRDLHLYRDISIAPERQEAILMKLNELEFSRQQAMIAENWIIWGDWKYRGTSPTLEISDFYPTDEQRMSVQSRFAPEYDRKKREKQIADQERLQQEYLSKVSNNE